MLSYKNVFIILYYGLFMIISAIWFRNNIINYKYIIVKTLYLALKFLFTLFE